MNECKEKKRSSLSRCEVIVPAWFQLQSPCTALGFLPCCWMWRVQVSLDLGVRGDWTVLCQENSLCSFDHLWLQRWLPGQSCWAAIGFQSGNGPSTTRDPWPRSASAVRPKARNAQLSLGCWGSSGHSLQPQVHFNILLPMDLWRCRMSCLYLLDPWRNLGMSCIKKLLMPCGKSLKQILFGIDSLCTP